MDHRIRIVIVDDHTLFRESVARLLDAEEDFVVAGRCGSAAEALQLIPQIPVDVVLLDYDLGTDKGTDFLIGAKALGFGGRVLVVTAGVGDSEGADMIRHGIAGMLRKQCPPDVLVQAIRDVYRGQEHFDPGYLRSLLVGMAVLQPAPGRKKFTEREREVLRYVFEGLANKEIAGRLKLSESSVKAAMQQLFAKTGVRTRSQLVRVVLETQKDQL